LDLTKAIPLLVIAMVQPAFGALLVTAVGATSLAEPCVSATGETAIALAAIAADAQEEHDAAFAVPATRRLRPSSGVAMRTGRRH